MSNSFDQATRSVGMRRVVQRHPYTGQGIDSLTAQVNALLKADKNAQRVILDVNRDHVLLETLEKGQSDPDELAKRFDDTIRQRPMTEYIPENPKMPPAEQFLEMFRLLTDEALEVAFILAGNLPALGKWIKTPPKKPRLFGVPVHYSKMVPNDVFLICGAGWHDAEPEDIAMTIKGNLP